MENTDLQDQIQKYLILQKKMKEYTAVFMGKAR